MRNDSCVGTLPCSEVYGRNRLSVGQLSSSNFDHMGVHGSLTIDPLPKVSQLSAKMNFGFVHEKEKRRISPLSQFLAVMACYAAPAVLLPFSKRLRSFESR